MTYPGGKNGAGVFQTIINMMPPHQLYVEPFAGSGAIMRMKRPAAVNIGLDLDAAAIANLSDWARSTIAKRDDASGEIAISGDADRSTRIGDAGSHRPTFIFEERNALDFLRARAFNSDDLVYCDPPYMHETRSRRDLYRFEMSDEQHRDLLGIIRELPCRVMISGYYTKLYARELAEWKTKTFQAVTRSGRMATEWLWLNFREPVALHDYRYLGRTFRERERIKRKTLRWTRRLGSMPMLERRAMMHALELASPNG